MKYKRIFLIVLESLGIGATNDSDKYGDGSSNTLLHVIENNNTNFPNLKSMGLFQLLEETDDKMISYYTKAIPASDNKNTFINYQEMMGNATIGEKKLLDLKNIDKDLYNYIESEIDRRLIISDKDSDINIINKYGENHIKSSDIIMTYDYYTFKIFAHDAILPIKELARIGKMILDIFDENNYIVNKLVAVGFNGKPGNFNITQKLEVYRNKQYKSTLELLKEKGHKIITIGKATKIFNNNEMTNVCVTHNDIETIKKIIKATSFNFTGVCIASLSDLNKMGHNRDKEGFTRILKGFDNSIPLIAGSLRHDDLLIITSDLGNDPTFTGNDHTREKVPVLVFNGYLNGNGEIPYLQSLCDIGATISDNFKLSNDVYGKSFLERIK